MKILHISKDSQFTQFIAKTFEIAAPNANDYLIISEKNSLNYKIHQGLIKVITKKNHLIREYLFIKKYNIIVVHGLDEMLILLFLCLSNRIIKVWSGWGFDYYLKHENNLIEKHTRNLLKEVGILNKKNIYFQEINFRMKAKCIKNVHYFSAPIPNDLKILKNNYPTFCGEYVQLNYGSLEETFCIGGGAVNGNNILVGNSATPENNHIDIFYKINITSVKGRIIVPLSYGNEDYKKLVIEYGYEKFGEKFYPLTEMLSLQKYSEIISSCEIVIMGHKRQQALGNICSAMYKGSRIILNKINPLFDFFLDKGAIIYSLEDIDHLINMGKKNSRQKEINRNVLKSFWGKDHVQENTNELILKLRKKLKDNEL